MPSETPNLQEIANDLEAQIHECCDSDDGDAVCHRCGVSMNAVAALRAASEKLCGSRSGAEAVVREARRPSRFTERDVTDFREWVERGDFCPDAGCDAPLDGTGQHAPECVIDRILALLAQPEGEREPKPCEWEYAAKQARDDIRAIETEFAEGRPPIGPHTRFAEWTSPANTMRWIDKLEASHPHCGASADEAARSTGTTIRNARTEAGMSLRELAAAVGISNVEMGEIERGVRLADANTASVILAAIRAAGGEREPERCGHGFDVCMLCGHGVRAAPAGQQEAGEREDGLGIALRVLNDHDMYEEAEKLAARAQPAAAEEAQHGE